MNYTELCCKFNSDELSSEIIIAYLSEFPFESFTEEENIVKAYIDANLFDISAIETMLKVKGVEAELTYKTIEQTNWNAEWESNFQPVLVDNRCIVRTSFHNKPANIEFDILIEPKMSFGTGHHETTYLMLSSMLEMDFTGKDVLDMGCGTAVLAILASKMGANTTLAIDNDEWTYDNILENIALNKCENIETKVGDFELFSGKKFHSVIANINRNVLLEHIQYYSKSLDKDGTMLLSGFYKDDLEMIKGEAEKESFQFLSYKEKNNWVAVLFKKL